MNRPESYGNMTIEDLQKRMSECLKREAILKMLMGDLEIKTQTIDKEKKTTYSKIMEANESIKEVEFALKVKIKQEESAWDRTNKSTAVSEFMRNEGDGDEG